MGIKNELKIKKHEHSTSLKFENPKYFVLLWKIIWEMQKKIFLIEAFILTDCELRRLLLQKSNIIKLELTVAPMQIPSGCKMYIRN